MKKSKMVFTTLTEQEYQNFTRFIQMRGQPMAEYVLMSLAVLLEDDGAVIEKRKRPYDPKCFVNVRCSECVFKAVEEYAYKHKCKKTEVVAMAIKEAIQG